MSTFGIPDDPVGRAVRDDVEAKRVDREELEYDERPQVDVTTVRMGDLNFDFQHDKVVLSVDYT